MTLLDEHLPRSLHDEAAALVAALARASDGVAAGGVHELAHHCREHARPRQRKDKPRVGGVDGWVVSVVGCVDELSSVREQEAIRSSQKQSEATRSNLT